MVFSNRSIIVTPRPEGESHVRNLASARKQGCPGLERRDVRPPQPGDRRRRSLAAAAQIADARRAADTAAAAFPAWSATGPTARRAPAQSRGPLASKAPQFIELMAAETGATAGWSGFNALLAADMLREAAAMTTQIAGEVIPSDKPGFIAMASRQPAGVVLSIAPWNAPVILGMRAIAMPLACGNTVVLKASEICPGTHRLIAECLRDAGLPPGVLNVVTNAPEDAPALIETLIGHPAVRRVNFTGSTRVGRIIAQVAAKYLKPALARTRRQGAADRARRRRYRCRGRRRGLRRLHEPGPDLHVDRAPRGRREGRRRVRGQARGQSGSLVAGDPRKGNTPLGSLVGTDAATRMQTLMNDAVSKGAKVVAGGRSEGTLMSATVIDGVNSSMRIYAEESFGPVVCVVRVDGEDEAVASPTTPSTGCRRRCSAATSPAPSRSPSASSPASATSTVRPSTTRRRCRSAASRLRLWPLRRQGRHRGIHRTALDHDRDRAATLSDLRSGVR